MTSNLTSAVPLSWSELASLTEFQIDTANGATNSQARLRLFGHREADIRVILYRDNHAWCPYCQKIWLWLEEKQIPYRIEKVTMFCYGEKEAWYKRKVPSGMLPAIELDGRIITESDDILIALENNFGSLGLGMEHPKVLPLRQLERSLFRAWCMWLCRSARQEKENRDRFLAVIFQVETALSRTPSPYFLEDFGTADVIFTPYLERMNASLYYYKGYSIREENPRLAAWFAAMESRSTYRGTQSDFHTHVHDLPPQMGGCWSNEELQTKINQAKVDLGDCGSWFGLPDAVYPEPENSRAEALYRVVKHHKKIIRVNPAADETIDLALRCALTYMMEGKVCTPPADADLALRYLRDRISVPCDMSVYAAKRLRESLEKTAALAGDRQPQPIPTKHRYDRDPANFAAV
jgi:glutathione S-transferase